MITINHINNCIDNAIRHSSKLNDEILNLEGYSSKKIRHFLNNLMSIDNINYLEIGVWKGSTFISSLYENNVNSAYAVDNWSEFTDGDVSKSVFKNTTNKFLNNNIFKLFEVDCFKLDLTLINNPINVYLYDGAHDYNSQYNAITYLYPVLDNEFILLIDDYDWKDTNMGTQEGIKDMNLNILFQKHLKSSGTNDSNSWWNGFYIALLKK